MDPAPNSEVIKATTRVRKLAKAKEEGKAIWQEWKYGSGSTLNIPGVERIEVSCGNDGYTVRLGDFKLKEPSPNMLHARHRAVALARQKLEAALKMLPTDQTIDEPRGGF